MSHIIDMRKPTLAANSVTSEMLADSAVDLSTAKVTGQLPEVKLANAAVTEGKLAANAVSAAKLADNAVDLSTVKVTGQLPELKLANAAVTEGKLAANAVTATKIADNAVELTGTKVSGVLPLGKSAPDLKATLIIADDTLTTATGTAETETKNARFSLDSANIRSKNKLIVAVGIFTSNALKTATAKFYVDAETTSRLNLSSTSTTEELKTGNFVISDLADGIHTVKIKITNSAADGTTSMKQTEIYHVV